jgi:hypothetical protein
MTKKCEAKLNEEGISIQPGWIVVYNCAPNNNEYIGSSEEYLIEGIGLPANSFLDSPPDSREGFVIYRSHDKESWVQDADLRGKTAYDTVLRRTLVIDTFGPLPEHLTLQAPKTDFDIWDGEKWVTDLGAQTSFLCSQAEARKVQLIHAANQKSLIWQTQLLLGIVSETDKKKLTEWMIYVQALQSVDTSAPMTIEWPREPVE